MCNNQLLATISIVCEDLGRLAIIPHYNLSSRPWIQQTTKIKGCLLRGFKYKISDCNQNKEKPQIQAGQWPAKKKKRERENKSPQRPQWAAGGMSQKRVQNEDERAELRDQDVEVPASEPSSRLGLHLWSPILKRDEKDLEKWPDCWIRESQWGDTGCIEAF